LTADIRFNFFVQHSLINNLYLYCASMDTVPVKLYKKEKFMFTNIDCIFEGRGCIRHPRNAHTSRATRHAPSHLLRHRITRLVPASLL